MTGLLLIAIVTLWVYPFITFRLIKKSKISRMVLLRLSLLSCVVIFANIIKFSTISHFVDWLLFSIMVFTIWLWIWSGLMHEKKAISIPSKIVCVLSIMLNSIIGTVGLLGFLLTVSDIEPEVIKELPNGRIYKEYYNGILDSANKTVKIYQPVLMVFEWEKDRKKYFPWTPGYSSTPNLSESDKDRLILTVIEKDSVVWQDELKY